MISDTLVWTEVGSRKSGVGKSEDFRLPTVDAREFVRKLVAEGKLDEPKTNHVMVNLPEIGIEFLDVFSGLLQANSGNKFIIYCHCFSREKPPTDVRGRIPLDLPADWPLEIVHVRDVAPNKIMYSVEFVVPEHILVATESVKKSRLA